MQLRLVQAIVEALVGGGPTDEDPMGGVLLEELAAADLIPEEDRVVGG